MSKHTTPIVAPAKRTEGVIVEALAVESERLGAAEQEIAALEARRAGMLASGTLEEIHGLADTLARARLRIEIAESRVGALNEELKRHYAREAQAAVDAALAPLAAIDDEERRVCRLYEEHARLVAEDLTQLRELRDRRYRISQAVHALNGEWRDDRPSYQGMPIQQTRLPSVAGDGNDFWPRSPRAAMIDETARAALNQAALEEYHRGRE